MRSSSIPFLSFLAAFAAALVLMLVPACTTETPAVTTTDGGSGVDDDPTDPADGGAAPISEAAAACAKKCKGCCLPDGTCVAKPYWKQCGADGNACVTCDGDDRACRNGVCGCAGDADCGPGLVCDTESLKCKKPCTAGGCASGCCSAAGFCVNGNASNTCGTKGACVDCTKNPAGSACLGDTCGCKTAADCPSGQACDTATKTCTTTCSATQTCNGGCCDATTNKCAPGLYTNKCGATGGMCADCTGNVDGNSCVNGSCGCFGSTSCPVGQACSTTTKKCTTACSKDQTCNGACCSSATNGTCQPGDANNACGAASTVCTNCGTATVGPTCMTSGVGNKVCGCADQASCGFGRECKAGAGRSYKWCCLPTGSFCVVGNNECCSGSCSGINGNTKCN